jgi:hypothetical protein
MHRIKSLTRLGVVLATLGVIALAFASGASASTGMVPRPGGTGGVTDPSVAVPDPTTVVRTVVVGGMPGWQIAAIAIAAALVAATAAVLLDRVRPARRRPLGAAA